MIGERSNKLLSQFVVLFQNILVLSGGQDLCMASDVITNMSYKPSYIDRQRIFNALMLYSTIYTDHPINIFQRGSQENVYGTRLWK